MTDKPRWPKKPDGTTDWEVVFEDPENGLIPLIEQSRQPEALRQCAEVVISQLFTRKGDAVKAERYRGELERMAENAGGAGFEAQKTEVIAFLRRIKRARQKKAAAYSKRKTKGDALERRGSGAALVFAKIVLALAGLGAAGLAAVFLWFGEPAEAPRVREVAGQEGAGQEGVGQVGAGQGQAGPGPSTEDPGPALKTPPRVAPAPRTRAAAPAERVTAGPEAQAGRATSPDRREGASGPDTFDPSTMAPTILRPPEEEEPEPDPGPLGPHVLLGAVRWPLVPTTELPRQNFYAITAFVDHRTIGHRLCERYGISKDRIFAAFEAVHPGTRIAVDEDLIRIAERTRVELNDRFGRQSVTLVDIKRFGDPAFRTPARGVCQVEEGE